MLIEPRIPLAIASARLRLRLPRDQDWRPLHAYFGDADSTRYTTGRAFTEAETWRALATLLGHWVLRGWGPYVLEELAGGDAIGVAGLWFPNDWPEPEIKWALVPAARGRGFAAEAARAVRAMAAEHLPDLRLISLIRPDNAPSVRVARAVGAVFEREIPFRDGVAHIYRHRADG